MNLGEVTRLREVVDRISRGLDAASDSESDRDGRQMWPEAALSVSQRQVLEAVGLLGADACPSTVALAISMRRSNVSEAMSSLRQGGLIEPDAAPDSRRRVVRLTAAGSEALVRLDRRRTHRLAQRVGTRLASDEARRVAAVIPLLARLADGD